jgi:uncharacterized protein
MVDTKAITVEWVDSAENIRTSLWETCFPPPLEGRWWYSALEQAGLEDQFKFSYGVIRRGEDLVGIAPSFLMDVPIDLVMPPFIAWLMRTAGRFIRPLQYQRTLFIGSPCADEGTVGLLPGISFDEVVLVLQESLNDRAHKKNASIIVWKDFPQTSALHLGKLCNYHKLFKMVSYPGTFMPLMPGGFEAYLKSLSSQKRNKLKQKLKKSRACGDLETEIIQHPNEKTQEEIFNLFWQTYLKGNTKFERLTSLFFHNIARTNVSHFILLRRAETKELAAFMLCFLLGRTVINKFIGLDYRLTGNWYLYFRLNEQAIDWASRAGAEKFQSGQTGYTAKFDLGHKLVPLTNYCRHRNPILNSIFAFIARRVKWADIDKDLKVYVRAHERS